MVSSLLENEFDDGYTYIRNYPIPKFKGGGDIDGILITPKGIFILEVKFFSGSFEIDNGYFYKKDRKGLILSYSNHPIRQANKQREYITELLNKNGHHVHIRSLVVLAHGCITEIRGSTGIYVLKIGKLIDFIKKELVSLTIELESKTIDPIICLLAKNAVNP